MRQAFAPSSLTASCPGMTVTRVWKRLKFTVAKDTDWASGPSWIRSPSSPGPRPKPVTSLANTRWPGEPGLRPASTMGSRHVTSPCQRASEKARWNGAGTQVICDSRQLFSEPGAQPLPHPTSQVLLLQPVSHAVTHVVAAATSLPPVATLPTTHPKPTYRDGLASPQHVFGCELVGNLLPF